MEHLPVEMAIAPSLRQIMEGMAIHPSLRQIMEEMAIHPSLRQRMVHAVKAEKGFTHQRNGRRINAFDSGTVEKSTHQFLTSR